MPTNIYQRGAMTVAIAACFPATVLGAGVARVDFASGNVAAISADGKSRALAKGSEIEVGETISTQAGRAQLRFSDGAYMSLQPQTEFKVEEFKFSGKPEASDNIVMNLLKGGMRTITGLIGRNNRNAYRLKTDVATIGIRGTEYTVKYTNSIEVFVADGVVSVENQSGSFTVPGGTGVMVSNQQTPPQQSDQKPVLPPESPSQQDQEEQQQQVADPVNPIQESTPPVSNVVQQPLLTGTLDLNIAIANWDTCSDSCNAPNYDPELRLSHQGTLDTSGRFISLSDTDGGQFPNGVTTSGSTTIDSAGNDGTLAWGRWHSGILGGDGEQASNSSDHTTGLGLFYVVGVPVTNMPTSGSAVYAMAPGNFAAACTDGGCLGATVTESIINVNFTSSSASLAMKLDLNIGGSTQTLNLNSSGSRSGAALAFNVSGGLLLARGFLAGDGATRAGLAWQGEAFTGAGGSGYATYAGVTAHKKQ